MQVYAGEMAQFCHSLLSNHSAVKRKQNNFLLSLSKKTPVIGGGIPFIDQT